MKNYLLLFAAITTLGLFSCSKDSASATAETDTSNQQLQASTWKVSSFTMGNADATNDFNGFGFNFRSDGNTSAANGLLSINGTWGISTTNKATTVRFSYDGSDTFQSFDYISGNWTVMEHSATHFVFNRKLGDNGSQVDVLVIDKI